ncbi:unnamed protein product [Polarella glacialis]|uniref:Uncharacterized protein n=1 Tax=Polarella glacialis TaxID=89957 RepID=A0A813I1M1_POLGL|nr:unnamed protein product [Polarella glacialis]CAE8643841.1 unnamed protein product [Polarella glacialis]
MLSAPLPFLHVSDKSIGEEPSQASACSKQRIGLHLYGCKHRFGWRLQEQVTVTSHEQAMTRSKVEGITQLMYRHPCQPCICDSPCFYISWLTDQVPLPCISNVCASIVPEPENA